MCHVNKVDTDIDIPVWPTGADDVLHDCFEFTDCRCSERQLQAMWVWITSIVTSYIRKCADITITRTITQPGALAESWTEGSKLCVQVWRCTNSQSSKEKPDSRHNEGKKNYALKFQGHVSTNDPWSMWTMPENQGLQQERSPMDPSLPDAFNIFYALWEDYPSWSPRN